MKSNLKYLILLFLMYSNFTTAQDPVLLATYNDIRRFDHVINLDNSIEPTQVYYSDNSSLSGYEVFASRKINVNIYGYLTNDLGIVNSTGDVFNSLGLFPVLNSYASISRNIDTLDQFSFKIPYNASEIEELRVGDAIYYQSTGGISMYLNFGIGNVGLGPKVSVHGGFTTYIEKKEADQVFVEIRKTHIKSFSLLAGTLGAYGEKAIIKELTTGVNFLIDLSTSEGQKVYEDLVKTGRADLAQESTSTVTKVGDVSSIKTSRFTKFALATPIIPFIDIATTRVSETRNEQRTNIWDQSSNTTVYLKGRRKTKRIFSKKSETSKIFETIENAETGSIESASLTIKKIKSNYSTRTLVETFRYFFKKTGLSFFRDVFLNFPGRSLGYANVEAKLTLSSESINFLERKYGENISASTFSILSRNFIKNDNFKNLLDIVQSCGGELNLVIEGKRITRSLVSQSFLNQNTCL